MMLQKTHGKRTKVVIATAAAVVIVAGALTYPSWSNTAAFAGLQSSALSDTTFPPPISSTVSSQPSYAVQISDASGQSIDKATFSPATISIPAGMTVIWTNDGAGQHTVTTVSSSDYSPPEAFASDMIAADGGTFAHTFTRPGVYRYTDLMNPKSTGIVDVGGAFEVGHNFDMLVGGTGQLRSTANAPHGLTLRFIPTTLSIPPTTAVTYKVTVAKSGGSPLFSRTFDDTDGILDLELIAHATSAPNQFVTWGPDFAGQEGFGSTGTFHIQGPFTAGQYSITVAALSRDSNLLDGVSDNFTVNLQGS